MRFLCCRSSCTSGMLMSVSRRWAHLEVGYDPRTHEFESNNYTEDYRFIRDSVRVQWLAAPVHKSIDLRPLPYHKQYDIMARAKQSKIRRVAGTDGLGQVILSTHPRLFARHDYVVPIVDNMGTFRVQGNYPFHSMAILRRGRELYDRFGLSASLLFQLGGLAQRLLLEMGECLSDSDYIVQTGGDSSVGFMMSQLANFFGYRMISLIPKQLKNIETIQNELLDKGRNHKVLLYESTKDDDALQSLVSDSCGGAPPALAIHNLSHTIRVQGTTQVYYGDTRKQRPTIPNYIHNRFPTKCDEPTREHVLLQVSRVNQLVDLLLDGHIVLPQQQQQQVFGLREWKLAQDAAQHGEVVVVLDCQKDRLNPEEIKRKKVYTYKLPKGR